MELREYLKNKNRVEFAQKIGTSINYLNNMCQRPELAGKKMIFKIMSASDGAVTFDDFAKQAKKAA